MYRERQEHRVFDNLLRMVPGLQDRLTECTEDELNHIADLVRLYQCELRPDFTT